MCVRSICCAAQVHTSVAFALQQVHTAYQLHCMLHCLPATGRAILQEIQSCGQCRVLFAFTNLPEKSEKKHDLLAVIWIATIVTILRRGEKPRHSNYCRNTLQSSKSRTHTRHGCTGIAFFVYHCFCSWPIAFGSVHALCNGFREIIFQPMDMSKCSARLAECIIPRCFLISSENTHNAKAFVLLHLVHELIWLRFAQCFCVHSARSNRFACFWFNFTVAIIERDLSAAGSALEHSLAILIQITPTRHCDRSHFEFINNYQLSIAIPINYLGYRKHWAALHSI